MTEPSTEKPEKPEKLEKSPRIRCAICGTRVREADETERCEGCDSVFHAACWSAIGGCATYGCKKAAKARKAPPPKATGGGWGDEKTCPVCEVSIPSSLLVCRACKATFPWADPMSKADYDAHLVDVRASSRQRRILTVLFLASLTIVGSAVAGPAGAIYAFTKRKRLVGADAVYVAMGYGSALLGVAWGVMLLVLSR